MENCRDFIDQATRLVEGHAGKSTAFWFDVDFIEFKFVNRCYGKEKGSSLLNAFSDFLEIIPEVILANRIFSDRFIFLVQMKKPATGEKILSLWHEYAGRFLAQQRGSYPACNLKLSCGISPVLSDQVLEDIDNAALAHHEAKQNHRYAEHGAVFFNCAMIEKIRIHQETERRIAVALHKEEFTFYLQPKVNLITGQIVGSEALVRGCHPDGQIFYPKDFCEVMEANGTIIELDYLIFRKVCAYLAERRRNGLPVVCTSVNLSRLHIEHFDTADRLHRIAQEYEIPPWLLEFELTETVLLNKYEQAKTMLNKLRAYRYKVAIDDYGSGYNSFTIWKELSFDVIKADKCFLDGTDFQIAKFVPGLVEIAKSIGVQLVCEGVEHEMQCHRLLDWGCNLAQGYYFSPPVPPEVFYQDYKILGGYFSKPCINQKLGRNR